jgi:hypothetical protein
VKIGIGIVAHVRRFNAARGLAKYVGAQLVSWDYGCLGPEQNHLGVWNGIAELDTDWSVVLEDDALPCKDFRAQLAMVLEAAPTQLVSLYLGTGHGYWHPRVERSLQVAHGEDAHYLVCRNVMHAVAVAMPTALVPSMTRHVAGQHVLPIDDRLTVWAVDTLGTQAVSYPLPSLVDHADWPTLIDHPDGDPRTEPRVAWECGTREHWVGRAVVMSL